MDQTSPNSALRLAMSGNQDARHQLVQRIFQTLGLKTKSTDLLHQYQNNSRPSVAISVEQPHDRKAGLYAAAYHGLLADEPGQLVFHPAKHGKDWLHSLRLKGEADQISQAFDQAGIPQRHLIPIKDAPGSEYRVLVYDKGGKYLQPMQALADQVGGEIYTQPGTGMFLGGKDKSAAHQSYRNVIDKVGGNGSFSNSAPKPKDENGMVKGSEAAKFGRDEAGKLRMARLWDEHKTMMGKDIHPGIVADWLDDDSHPNASIVRGHDPAAHHDWRFSKDYDWNKAESVPTQHGMMQFLPRRDFSHFIAKSILHTPGEEGARMGSREHYARFSPDQVVQALAAAKRHDYKPNYTASLVSPESAGMRLGFAPQLKAELGEQAEEPKQFARAIAERLLKMARPFEGDHQAMIDAVRNDSEDKAVPKVLGDFLEEDSHPLAHALTHGEPRLQSDIDWIGNHHTRKPFGMKVQHGSVSVLPKKDGHSWGIEGFLEHDPVGPNGRKPVYGNTPGRVPAYSYDADDSHVHDLLRRVMHHNLGSIEAFPDHPDNPELEKGARLAELMMKKLGVQLPERMSRRDLLNKLRRYAAFSQNPQQQLNISVPLPEAVSSTPQTNPTGNIAAQSLSQAPAQMAAPQSRVKASPMTNSTVLPYYEEESRG